MRKGAFKSLSALFEIVPLKITVLRPDLDVSITEISFTEENTILVSYEVNADADSSETLVFRLLDDSRTVIEEVSSDARIVDGVYTGSVELSLEDAKEGLLRVLVLDVNGALFTEETVIYDGSVVGTGFAFANIGDVVSPLWITVFLFLVAVLLIVRRIFRLKHGYVKENFRKKVHRKIRRHRLRRRH